MNPRVKNKALSQWLVRDRLPHALLMVGASLDAQQSLALQLAQFLLCEQGNECEGCKSCQWVATWAHPDLLLLPQGEESSIKIDDIRQVIHHFSQSAHQGKYKIVILAPAEAMLPAAMNALLKTLEEPPPQSILILLSQIPGLLPATIRSRCQRMVVTDEKMANKEVMAKLTDTLQAIGEKKLDPLQAAQMWQKVSFATVLEALYYCALHIILNKRSNAKKLFAWVDKITQLRLSIMRKLNPNQVLALENIFFEWMQINDVG